MRRLQAACLLVAALAAGQARGQWVFDPSVYRHSGQKIGQAEPPAPSFAAQPPSQAVPAQPRQDSGWDTSGVIGRGDRDSQWRHDEKMNDWDKYWEGLRDGANAVRPWYPPGPGPLPPLQGAPGLGQPPAQSYTTQPQQSSEWDTSGVIGRGDRDSQWRHVEKMNDSDKYWEGLRDGADAVRPWYPPGPGPLPPILGTPGHGRPPAKPGKRKKGP